MKKSSFVALILGTVSGVLFALGMCMALLPEWDALLEGVIFGGVGLIVGVATLLIWAKMEHKTFPKLNGKNVWRVLYTVVRYWCSVPVCVCAWYGSRSCGEPSLDCSGS